MGIRSYTAIDLVTRKRRMEGKCALSDRLGCLRKPTENFAIKHKSLRRKLRVKM